MSFILGANYQYYLGFSALCTRISALLPGTFCSISYFFDNGFTLVEPKIRNYLLPIELFPPLMTAMSLNWMRFLSLLKGNVLRLIWLLALRNELKFGPHRVLTLAAFDIISQLPDLNLNG